MSRYLLSAVVLLSLVAAIGCGGGKQLTQSYWAPRLQPTDIKTSGYNKDTKLSWLVSNDSANLYLKAHTADLKTQKAIAMYGLRFFVDTTSKKKKDCYVRFPDPQPGMMMMGPPPSGQGQASHLQIILSKSGNLYWKNGEATYLINTLVERSAFGAKASVDDMGVMQWYTQIPLAAIWPTGYNAEKSFSVGVEVSYGGADVDFKQMDNGSGVDMQQTNIDPDNRRPIGTVAPNAGIGTPGTQTNTPSSSFPSNSGNMPSTSWSKMKIANPATSTEMP